MKRRVRLKKKQRQINTMTILLLSGTLKLEMIRWLLQQQCYCCWPSTLTSYKIQNSIGVHKKFYFLFVFVRYRHYDHEAEESTATIAIIFAKLGAVYPIMQRIMLQPKDCDLNKGRKFELKLHSPIKSRLVCKPALYKPERYFLRFTEVNFW